MKDNEYVTELNEQALELADLLCITYVAATGILPHLREKYGPQHKVQHLVRCAIYDIADQQAHAEFLRLVGQKC